MKHANIPRTGLSSASMTQGACARRRRDRELPMSERLERVHRLCAQLASLKPIRAKHPG